MDPYINEWLNLVLRWAHIILGIAWIGHSFFFMWLDANLTKPQDAKGRGDVEGELWMVHSGGFYQVEKKNLAPGDMPQTLHWFKYEALFTWVTGVLLLLVVYYLGGALIGPDSEYGFGIASAVGLGLIPVAWKVYDVLWQSPLAKNSKVAGVVSTAAVVAISYALSEILSPRAAYIHVGAMLGSLMMFNVWGRILPAQSQMIEARKAGKQPDMTLGAGAKTRSIHNNYMTFPLIFIMISNHFPSTTYGYHWLMLAAIMLAGAGVRHLMNVGGRGGAIAAGGGMAVLLGVTLSMNPSDDAGEEDDDSAAEDGSDAPAKEVDPATAGTIRGEVSYDGAVPDPAAVDVRADPFCAAQHKTPPVSDAILVANGKVQNAFVYVKSGLEGYGFPKPDGEVEIDQVGCLYNPRIQGVQVGQDITFINSDNTNHNIHTVADRNRSVNFSMPNQGMRKTKRMRKPEVMVTTKCDVHPWMNMYIGVVRHPFFAVTGPDGSFTFEGLPPGEYELEAWHEVFGTRSVDVSLPAKGDAQASFAFSD